MEEEEPRPGVEILVSRKYRLGRKLAPDSPVEAYVGININTGEEVAMKLECIHSRQPKLEHESHLYKLLQGGAGIPSVRSAGVEGEYHVLIMDLLGSNLEELFIACGHKFSVKTVIMLADQMIKRLELVHARGLVHRDIKPEHFVMSRDKAAHQVFIIDFGLAKKYRDPKGTEHMPYREDKNMTGSPRYASVNSHLGIEQSRRDDLESLGYVLMYLLRGTLPWQGLQADSKREKYELISHKKMETSFEVLCEGFPVEFVTYFKAVRALAFDEKPDYSYLRRVLRERFAQEGWRWDYKFDWDLLAERPPAPPPVDQAPAAPTTPSDDGPPSRPAVQDAEPASGTREEQQAATEETTEPGTLQQALVFLQAQVIQLLLTLVMLPFRIAFQGRGGNSPR